MRRLPGKSKGVRELRQLAADIGAALERAIGSAGLSSRVRAHVWSAQLRSIQQLAVIVWANASLVAAVLLFVAAGVVHHYEDFGHALALWRYSMGSVAEK